MILVTHILVVLSSVGLATYLFFKPSVVGLRVAYGLVIATIASGTYLTIASKAHVMSACTTGLIYLAVMGVQLYAARRRQAHATVHTK